MWNLAAYCTRSHLEISKEMKMGGGLTVFRYDCLRKNALECLDIDVLKLFLFMNFSNRPRAPSVTPPCLCIKGVHEIIVWGWFNAVNRELKGLSVSESTVPFLIPSRTEAVLCESVASTFIHPGCSYSGKPFQPLPTSDGWQNILFSALLIAFHFQLIFILLNNNK